MQIRYYMICSRFESLIASHLDPEAFGTYMAVGTKKLASGHVVFFEIDPGFTKLTDHFHVEDIETRCAPHADGSPKRSKYISVYRVMEFLPLPVYRALYLTTPDGRVLRIDETPFSDSDAANGINLFQELCPLIPMVVSSLPPREFVQVLTNPAQPRQRAAAVLRRPAPGSGRARQAGRLAALHRPAAHRGLLKELALAAPGSKPTKTVSRTPRTRGFFRAIRRGFFLGDQTGLKFYRFPSREDLEVVHQKWWHSASAQ